jgi:hypothetical protein
MSCLMCDALASLSSSLSALPPTSQVCYLYFSECGLGVTKNVDWGEGIAALAALQRPATSEEDGYDGMDDVRGGGRTCTSRFATVRSSRVYWRVEGCMQRQD